MGPVLAALVLLASPAPGPGPAESDASTIRPGERRAIVFMVSETRPEATAVAAAIEVQIADLDARLEIEALPASTDLGARLATARGHAAAHEAIGVFWLDVDAEGNLLLHLVDPAGERMLVRRVEPSPESDTAAIQTVAVIARGFASALLEGRTIGLSRVETASQATEDELAPLGRNDREWTPARPRGRLRVGAAYYGAHVAPQGEWIWQSGLATNIAWQWRVGVYAGLGYDVTQRFVVVTASELAMNTIATQVRRNPASVLAGYQHVWPRRRLALDGELRFLVDIHTVNSETAIADTIVSEDAIAPFFLLSPRATLHFRPVPYFSAQLTVGAEIVLEGRNFVAEFKNASGETLDERAYLEPSRFRPLVLAGLTFYL